MSNEQHVNILDCTLRDGGYYNNWHFPQTLVENYLSSVARAQIDYVELGLRQFNSGRFLGAHAFTTPQYLASIDLPKGPEYGVMVDAKTLLKNEEEGSFALVEKLFLPASNEKISFVRIAAHVDEVAHCGTAVGALRGLGYKVFLNIMQASLRTDKELKNLGKIVSKYDELSAVYIADSLGSMCDEEVTRVFNALKSGWSGELGFHAHDNTGRAMVNTQLAIKLGTKWVDSTVTGMGRGAGNAATEFLVLSIPRPKVRSESLIDLFEIAAGQFTDLKRVCGWGHNAHYHMAANLSLHPTYVQELLTDRNFSTEMCFEVIEALGASSHPNKFSNEVLIAAKSMRDEKANSKVTHGEIVPKILTDKDVLLVAQTDQAEEFESALNQFINFKKPLVISLNMPLVKTSIEYDYVAISHNQKYKREYVRYKESNYKFIAPAKLFDDDLRIGHDYGVGVESGRFEALPNHAIIPSPLTFSYALAFCIAAGAKRCFLAGFEGLSEDSEGNKEMQFALQLASKCDIELISITPTTYPVKEISVYDLYSN